MIGNKLTKTKTKMNFITKISLGSICMHINFIIAPRGLWKLHYSAFTILPTAANRQITQSKECLSLFRLRSIMIAVDKHK